MNRLISKEDEKFIFFFYALFLLGVNHFFEKISKISIFRKSGLQKWK